MSLDFIKNKAQRIDWIILLVSCIVGYIVLRICYPYPATMSDSGTYVQAAVQDAFTVYRPFGYSRFLQFVHTFSSSVQALVIAQMLVYFLSVSAFSFTIKYFFPPKSTLLWRILLFLFVFNPTALYMTNAIMSDLLFATTIYLMLASFVFVLKRQSWIALALTLLFLLFTLHIRYSAVLFPVTFICLFAAMKGKIRWAAIALTLFVSFVFYRQMQTNMKETVGIAQFSTGFDGWQMANNAMHVVPYSQLDPQTIKDPEMRELHQFMLTNKGEIERRTDHGTKAVASFMWLNDLPLKQYLYYYCEKNQLPYPMAWVKLGSGLYKDYGQYMILRHPKEFMLHYYLPNSTQIVYPNSIGLIGEYTPLEIKDIREWYKIPADKNTQANYPIYDTIAKMIPVGYLVIWIVITVLAVLNVVFRKRLVWEESDQKVFWGIVLFGVIYYTSTVFASPVELRFLVSMTAIQFAVVYILSNRLIPLCLRSK